MSRHHRTMNACKWNLQLPETITDLSQSSIQHQQSRSLHIKYYHAKNISVSKWTEHSYAPAGQKFELPPRKFLQLITLYSVCVYSFNKWRVYYNIMSKLATTCSWSFREDVNQSSTATMIIIYEAVTMIALKIFILQMLSNASKWMLKLDICYSCL